MNKRKNKKADFLRDEKSWYNKVYAQDVGNYSGLPDDSPYLDCWKYVCLKAGNERIADFGCGPGQFAEYCIQNGNKYVLGIDFSDVAISIAKNRNPTHSDYFITQDLCSLHIDHDTYDVAVILETLEHIKDDFVFLEQIPLGKHIIISLPSFDYTSHHRFFPNKEECIQRYNKSIKINEFEFRKDRDKPGNIYWLIEGFKL